MSTTTYTLDADKGIIERALSTFEQQRRQLFRGDGTPMYAPAEHQERLAGLLAPLLERFNDLESAINEASAEAERLESVAQGCDPLAALSSDELSRAASLRALLSAEITAMPLVELHLRLTAASLGSDKPLKVVIHRLASERYQATLDALGRGSNLAGPHRDPTAERHAVGRIASLVGTIGAAIADPKATKVAADAAALRQKVSELRRWAIATRNDATGETAKARVRHGEWTHQQF